MENIWGELVKKMRKCINLKKNNDEDPSGWIIILKVEEKLVSTCPLRSLFLFRKNWSLLLAKKAERLNFGQLMTIVAAAAIVTITTD